VGSIHDSPVFVLELSEEQTEPDLEVTDVGDRDHDEAVVRELGPCRPKHHDRVSGVLEDVTKNHDIDPALELTPHRRVVDAAHDHLVVMFSRLFGGARVDLDSRQPSRRAGAAQELTEVSDRAANVEDRRAIAGQLRQPVARILYRGGNASDINELVPAEHGHDLIIAARSRPMS
jgi:hypothetical protein